MAFLRHIALRTQDMEASRRFYETIGFEFVGYRGRGGLDLSDGTLNMTIIQYNGEARTAFEEGTEFIHFGIIVEDLASIYNTLREGGFELLMDNVKKGDDISADKPPERSFIVKSTNKFTFSEIYVSVYDYGLFNRFTQTRARFRQYRWQ